MRFWKHETENDDDDDDGKGEQNIKLSNYPMDDRLALLSIIKSALIANFLSRSMYSVGKNLRLIK